MAASPESMYTREFAEDPHAAYERWRREHGPLVPVELTPGVRATLVLGYATALRILNDPGNFPADPRTWQASVPSGCPVLPLMQWRPNALHSSGSEHQRYRSATVAALETVDLHGMHTVVERIALPLIEEFGTRGGAHHTLGGADLLEQYIYPLVYRVLDFLLGFDADTGERIGAGMAMIFDSAADAATGNAMMTAAMSEHIERKRARPGADITSHLITRSDLSTEELIHQLSTLYGGGSEPQAHLISNTLLLMMTDNRFAGDLISGSLSTRDALDEVLFSNPPLANFCMTYPRQPILIDGVWLPAHQPVLISMAAGNTDPAIHSENQPRFGNRAHLSWGAGPHQCPARQLGYQIAMDAIDQLLDFVPDMKLAVPESDLTWRPGPFHRALESLPVVFPSG
ncbi:cytochrome P450 [Nocardia sp. CDC160]|uniref:cytochrome P450 n=1 Tax=Nocardia sp. CDC160 TaxID=3112166 RepID=UPI002DB96FF4|nr:cytochrome P450 [Nocardia sp. CDC160]MEC3918977.1 cytochrome P450 [Nocardia sp. CDC160]